ncbi:MAG: hypothetical protein EXS37_13660 [Opitutus sp.]|nr:hypothetical protein [Opitutus sp.]
MFWVLWALDGVRLGPRRTFTFVGGGAGTSLGRCVRRRGARINFSRLSLPGWWPGGWQMTSTDVPVSLSPVGVCNRPAGAAGRPGETPPMASVWRWEEVREAGVAGGWVFVNGARFYPDTGHLTAPDLLALARLAPAAREERIRALLVRWFRPVQLSRRVRVLAGRTRVPAVLNAVTLVSFAGLTIYVAGDFAARVPAQWSERLARALPWILLGLVALHVVAVTIVWRGLRALKSVRPEKRGASLFSALLLPPQALRLRAVAGEGFFPPQHPFAGVVAFGGRAACAKIGFDVLADLRWPIADANDPPLAREITAWFRTALEAKVTPLLATAGIAPEALLEPPPPDALASCRYCPRCRDQFVAGSEVCPHGVALRPLERSGK